jgi:hypothetical protein
MIGDVLALSITPPHLRVPVPENVEAPSDSEDSGLILSSDTPPVNPNPPPVILTPEQREFYDNDPSPFALPNVGSPISMSQIRDEVSGSGQVALNDAEFRALIGKSSGEQQGLYDYYGKSSSLSENTPAVSAQPKGYNCRTSETFAADSSRYLSVACGSVTSGIVSAEVWNMIPFTPPPTGTVVKLDYQITCTCSSNSNVIHNWTIGATQTGAPGFNMACSTNFDSSRQHWQSIAIINGDKGRFSRDWYAHVDGYDQKQQGSFSWTSKVISYSTFFTWGHDSTRQFLSFSTKINTSGGSANGTMRIDYKLTEM